ncbi:unnamed protein product, partial [Strongylus vulgaris]
FLPDDASFSPSSSESSNEVSGLTNEEPIERTLELRYTKINLAAKVRDEKSKLTTVNLRIYHHSATALDVEADTTETKLNGSLEHVAMSPPSRTTSAAQANKSKPKDVKSPENPQESNDSDDEIFEQCEFCGVVNFIHFLGRDFSYPFLSLFH